METMLVKQEFFVFYSCLSLLKCSVAELRTVHKVVLRELNHLCVPADLTKVDDRLDNVAKRILVIMLMLHPLL